MVALLLLLVSILVILSILLYKKVKTTIRDLKIQLIKDSNKILRDLINILYDKYGPKSCQDIFAIQLILVDKINEIILKDKKYKKTRQLKQAIADLYKYICEDKKYNSNRAYEILIDTLFDIIEDTEKDINKIPRIYTFDRYFEYILDKYYEIILNKMQKI